jgi:hypothetical protein
MRCGLPAAFLVRTHLSPLRRAQTRRVSNISFVYNRFPDCSKWTVVVNRCMAAATLPLDWDALRTEAWHEERARKRAMRAEVKRARNAGLACRHEAKLARIHAECSVGVCVVDPGMRWQCPARIDPDDAPGVYDPWTGRVIEEAELETLTREEMGGSVASMSQDTPGQTTPTTPSVVAVPPVEQHSGSVPPAEVERPTEPRTSGLAEPRPAAAETAPDGRRRQLPVGRLPVGSRGPAITEHECRVPQRCRAPTGRWCLSVGRCVASIVGHERRVPPCCRGPTPVGWCLAAWCGERRPRWGRG